MKSVKINSLNVYPVFSFNKFNDANCANFFELSGYCIKGTNCWEQVFSLNLFSRNILWRFDPKTGNPIQLSNYHRSHFISAK